MVRKGSRVQSPAWAPLKNSEDVMKRLTLDENNKKWLGLCAGIANYLEVDVTIVRIIVLVATILTGVFIGIITYLIVASITPKN